MRARRFVLEVRAITARRFVVGAAVVVLLAILLLGSCGGTDAPEGGAPATVATTTTAPAPPFQQRASANVAIDAGVAYLAAHLDDVDDTPSLMVIDYVARNWRLTPLDRAAEIATQRVAKGQVAAGMSLVRMIDPASPAPTEPVDLSKGFNEVLIAALNCDRVPVGEQFIPAIERQAAKGGYALTHVAMAAEWTRELGCNVAGVDTTRAALVDQLAAESAASAQQATSPGVDDIWVEQSAFLNYLGAGNRVPAGWSDQVLRSQRADGSWVDQLAAESAASAVEPWHTTVLAVWTLLAERDPGGGVPMLRAAVR